MEKSLVLSIAILVSISSFVSADTFGTGGNQFEIEFVTISGDASSANGTSISGESTGDPGYKTFTDPSAVYRMGKFEITNYQWSKFQTEIGVPVTGSPLDAYDINPHWTGMNVPTNAISWYEAAQFVNWLNTSTGHIEAYKFTGVQGTTGYSLTLWESGDVGYNANNPFRNSNAIYFLPTEDEWVKAAYWNGTNLQTWATTGDDAPTQDGWNFYDGGYATDPQGPWDVGSGSEELNGTFDMMGNVYEWMEGSCYEEIFAYTPDTSRGYRGGAYYTGGINVSLSGRVYPIPPVWQEKYLGFRVASVPEPTTLSLLVLGGLLIRKRK